MIERCLRDGQPVGAQDAPPSRHGADGWCIMVVVVVVVVSAAAAAPMVQLTLDPALEAVDDIFGRVGVWRGRMRSGVRRKGN